MFDRLLHIREGLCAGLDVEREDRSSEGKTVK
jgi:hypothetical protein